MKWKVQVNNRNERDEKIHCIDALYINKILLLFYKINK